MDERETVSDDPTRRTSIIVWMLAVVASFALGALVTHFALLRESIAQYTFQQFFTSPFWSAASIALVSFVLGLGFAFVPFVWYRQDANRILQAEHRALRAKTDALRGAAEMLRARESARATQEDASPPPPYAVQGDEGPQDIASVISEMSAAIKANLREPSAKPKAEGDARPSPRPKLFDE